MSGFEAEGISNGSRYSKSRPRKYCPVTLRPALSLNRMPSRNAPVKTLRFPPPTLTLVPGSSIGDVVMMCMMPFAELGPYSADPGPSTISMRSMSSAGVGIML
jgi:hypothetical protein